MRIPTLIVGSFFIPIGLLYVLHLYILMSASGSPLSQLVRMVCGREAPLDYANHWYWNIRLWPHDLLVWTNSSCLLVLTTDQPPAFLSFYTSSTRSHMLLAPRPLRPCFESTVIPDSLSPCLIVFIFQFLGFPLSVIRNADV